MARFRLALVFGCVVAAFVSGGCGKKKLPPPVAPAAPSQPQPAPVVKAPGGIPQEFADLVQAKWPEAEREGREFLAKFNDASAARKSDDRAKLATAIEEARRHYSAAKDAWAEIAYWPINQLDDGKIDEKTVERCERFVRTYSGKVKGWDKKAKGLKELSTVK
ncbi:MAG: hypothetical protein ACYTEZ_04680 [Planctomycetota bacterium]|jgi:hypothetical protein